MTDSELRKLIPAMPDIDGIFNQQVLVYTVPSVDAHALATARAVWAAAESDMGVLRKALEHISRFHVNDGGKIVPTLAAKVALEAIRSIGSGEQI